MGLHQMSEVIIAMLEMALLDQGSQEKKEKESKKSAWKVLKKDKTVTSNYPWTEYWFNGEVCFGHPNTPTL